MPDPEKVAQNINVASLQRLELLCTLSMHPRVSQSAILLVNLTRNLYNHLYEKLTGWRVQGSIF